MTDTTALKARLRRAERGRQLAAAGLVLPLVIFLLLTFALPIGGMLWRAVGDEEVAVALPRTVMALKGWDGRAVPDAPVFAALAADLPEAKDAGTLPAAARRLNYDVPGFRSLLLKSARGALPQDPAGAREALLAIDPEWSDAERWGAIQRAGGPLTSFYLLTAVDLHQTADGSILRRPAQESIYLDVLGRSFQISILVTVFCLLLGFPVAYLLAVLPPRLGNPLMILVLLPFWTSLLVRTTAWVVLLQNKGIVNDSLIALGILQEPTQLIYNRIGVYVAMTHVLLPFMILPLYSVMRGISPSFVRAARSLGAPPTTAFLRVYLPQCLPGIGAGCLLVFVLALGYYITPALVGGAGDQMIAYFIAFYTTATINWGLASALGVVLLVATLMLCATYNKLVGFDRVALR
ncbi:MAG TPA: ABC transporter permease [Kiloniellales bacterium]|jgi:putative spermidine/putrescine transport system permease protein